MDAVRIQIIRGCDASGQGGTVTDDATGVLGSLGETPILDLLTAAFADQYGLYQWPHPAFNAEQPESDENPRLLTVSPLRNISTRMRLFAQEIMTAYAMKVAGEAARQQAQQQTAAALSSLTIVENL